MPPPREVRSLAAARLLDGKSALITGAGGAIGRTTALTFAREGARLALSDASPGGLDETVRLVREAGGTAIGVVSDITDDAAVAALVHRSVEAYGRLDCAFNNAGINGAQAGSFGDKLADWPEAAFDRMLAVNLKGTWSCMRHQIRQMVAQGGGAIVNAGSIGGLTGRALSSGYVASKHGVIGLTRTAALEYAEAGLRINAVCPGLIETPMVAEKLARSFDSVVASIPMRRVGQAQEVAEMVAWFCSDRASYVTGAAFNVDGGYLAT